MNDKKAHKNNVHYTIVITDKSWLLVANSTVAPDTQWYSNPVLDSRVDPNQFNICIFFSGLPT